MNKSKTTDLPLCEPGAEPDRFSAFATLRERWKDAEEGRTYSSLAEHLDVTKQQITQWATGSGGKPPAPWWVIMTLCAELGYGIAIEPSGMALYRSTPPL